MNGWVLRAGHVHLVGDVPPVDTPATEPAAYGRRGQSGRVAGSAGGMPTGPVACAMRAAVSTAMESSAAQLRTALTGA